MLQLHVVPARQMLSSNWQKLQFRMRGEAEGRKTSAEATKVAKKAKKSTNMVKRKKVKMVRGQKKRKHHTTPQSLKLKEVLSGQEGKESKSTKVHRRDGNYCR